MSCTRYKSGFTINDILERTHNKNSLGKEQQDFKQTPFSADKLSSKVEERTKDWLPFTEDPHVLMKAENYFYDGSIPTPVQFYNQMIPFHKAGWCGTAPYGIVQLASHAEQYSSFLDQAYPHISCFYPHNTCPGYMLPPCVSKRKGGQIRFTAQQTKRLESKFATVKYLSPEDRRLLAVELKLSDRQVKTWFQNRRAKWRKLQISRDETQNPEDGLKHEGDEQSMQQCKKDEEYNTKAKRFPVICGVQN